MGGTGPLGPCASWAWEKGRKRPCRRRAAVRVAGVAYCGEHAVAHGLWGAGGRPRPLPAAWQQRQAALSGFDAGDRTDGEGR